MIRGIDTLRTMRLCGYAPSLVNVSLFPLQPWAKGLTAKRARHAEVTIEPQDVVAIERADLRPLTGLMVFVSGPNDDSTERTAKACLKAGARLVEAFFIDADKPRYDQIVKAIRLQGDEVRTVWPK